MVKPVNFRKIRGVSLIEVLVAALVLAIGLVGLAGLQLTAVKASHSSYYRSVATMIALDAEERAWIELGETGSLEDADLSDIGDEVLETWNNACPEDCSLLPGLDVEITSPNSTTEWIDVQVEVSWSEGRFVDVNGESFGYRTRVPTGN